MRARRLWGLYGLVLLLGLGGMGWITRVVVRSARSEVVARRQALLEEKTRQAVWRMETTLQLFLAPEAARPHFTFESFHRAAGAPKGQPGLMPSPMLLGPDPLVRLRFQVDSRGAFTSPLVPSETFRDLVQQAGVKPERMQAAAQALKDLRQRLDRPTILSLMLGQGAVLPSREDMTRLQSGGVESSFASPYQVFQGTWTPFWHGESLLMVRQVWVGPKETLQGCWLDWGELKEFLLSTVREGLPGAELKPVTGTEGVPSIGRMASLPVCLLPGSLPLPVVSPFRSGVAALWVGWCLALMGAVAGGLVLKLTLELGQRREAFASAVTHELRTPLTTFRLYTELLAHDMVPDEQERKGLLKTLLVEADRLDHLVKNVLAYSRMEARGGGRLESVTLGGFAERVLPRLEERARQSGLRLESEGIAPLERFTIHTDIPVTEQILLNLVDNACKYAGQVTDPPLLLRVSRGAGGWEFRVLDHGSGIAPADRARLFRPFEKLPNAASRNAPGVGLGLALSRDLAKLLGGTLVYEDRSEPGACFLLTLPF